MRTLSEIDTTVKRASKAIGFSWGIAEEIGKNIRLLELFGLPGVKNLNQYFKDYKTKQFQKISLISLAIANGCSKSEPFSSYLLASLGSSLFLEINQKF